MFLNKYDEIRKFVLTGRLGSIPVQEPTPQLTATLSAPLLTVIEV